MAFITVPFVVDSNQLADAAVTALQARWPGWEPSDGDMEVIQLEVLAPMAADAVVVAASVPDAIFRQYGLTMFGLSYREPTPAVGQATIWAVDDLGYRSDGPIEFALESVAFTTDTEVEIPAGETTIVVPVTCSVSGAIGNNLMGSGSQMSSFQWVDSILVDPQTQGGVDAESDSAYQDRLRDRLQLQATTLVNGRDFEYMALSQPDVGRALALVGTNRSVTVAITDVDGQPLLQANKDAVAALYDEYRQVNTTYSVIDPTYTDVDVAFSIETLDSYEAGEVLGRAIQALTDWLDPANWGKPMSLNVDTQAVWLQSSVVRRSEAIRVVSVPGVRWVQTLTIDGGTTDVNLSGTIPLTEPGSITGTVI